MAGAGAFGPRFLIGKAVAVELSKSPLTMLRSHMIGHDRHRRVDDRGWTVCPPVKDRNSWVESAARIRDRNWWFDGSRIRWDTATAFMTTLCRDLRTWSSVRAGALSSFTGVFGIGIRGVPWLECRKAGRNSGDPNWRGIETGIFVFRWN